MQLVYSALRPENNATTVYNRNRSDESVLRYLAYLETCEKYRHQIAAIRKYFPGWTPEFR